MSNSGRAGTALACCLSTQCYAGGGPNPFEGASPFNLHALPLIGYVVVFIVLAASGKFARAIGATVALALLLAAVATLGSGVGLVVVVLFGPWALLVGLLLSCLLPRMSNGNVRHDSSSPPPREPSSPWNGLP